MDEIWKPVAGYGGKYEVSSLGRVRSIDHARVRRSRYGNDYKSYFAGVMLKQKITSDGRHQVCLYGDGVKKHVSVHRLVLMSFVGACPDGMEACHNNGKPLDNRIENLRWDTRQSNLEDRKKHGSDAKGENHPQAKLTWALVNEIRAMPKFNREIAKRFGVDVSVGYKIRRNESWKSEAPNV